ncbi:MAG: type II toxin-antitoxin system VapC family toxin [Phycisphaerae bacterium]
MIYFLDTDICIFTMRAAFPKLLSQMTQMLPERFRIPAIVKAELLHGAARSSDPARSKSEILAFLVPFEIAPFDDACTQSYADIRSALERAGTPIGPNDYIIAATVMAHDGVLITHNLDEFRRVPGLDVRDWTK